MKVRKISDLVDWTRLMHHLLAEHLAANTDQNKDELARMLLAYVADHEAALAKIIDGFEARADPKALNTWMYDYLEHRKVDLARLSEQPFSEMTFDEICGSVFDAHNQAIELYRDLLGRADILEAKELLRSLLSIEEHETMRLAQQINRSRVN
ncbi:MAG: ATPase [Pseudomonadota bacterium]